MEYLDFDLEVTAADGGAYTVRVLRSPAGEASGTMRLPFDSLVLQNRLQALQIALLRSGTTRRRVPTAESQTVQTFGQELWGALFGGDIGARFEASRSEARRLDAGMRIKLRFEDAALAALPWEYLFDAGRGDFVTLSSATPVVRYIPLPQVMEPLAVQPPLRVLAMIASPSDLDALDVERERQRLGKALEGLAGRGLVELVWMTGSTARDLQQVLRRGPWHIFHFVGHGGFDAIRGEGLIALTTEAGTASQVSATDLGRLLGDHDPLRLAVLNACESARGDSVDVFASTAATLVRRGTPAVVAMQYEITDDAAIEFSRSFYEAIADGIPVDAALAEARKGVAMAIPGTLEWGTPVLYMRAPDGVLFDIPADARAAAMAPDRIEAPVTAAAAATAVAAPAAGSPPPVDASRPAIDVEAAPVAEVAPPPPVVEPPVSAPPQARSHMPPPPPAAAGPVAGWRPPGGTAASPPLAASGAAVASSPGSGAAAGARRASGGNGKWIAVGLVVLLVVAAGVVSALADGLNPPPFPTDGPRPTTPGAVVVPPVSSDRPIVFANDAGGNADLFAVDPSGASTVRLTSGAGDDRFPAWSPDGRRIAFTRIADGQGDLWVMAADGSEQVRVTDGGSTDWGPAWTPDGSALVFSSDRNQPGTPWNDIWIVALDGSDPRFLVGDPGHDDAWAVVAADLATVAFSSDRDGDARSLYLFDRFRNTIQRLTTAGWIDTEPAWSPARATLLFARASDQNPADRDVWSVRADDGTTTQLTTDEADEGHPVSSPDGRSYAFQRIVDGSYHILVNRPDGLLDLTAGLGGTSAEATWR